MLPVPPLCQMADILANLQSILLVPGKSKKQVSCVVRNPELKTLAVEVAPGLGPFPR